MASSFGYVLRGSACLSPEGTPVSTDLWQLLNIGLSGGHIRQYWGLECRGINNNHDIGNDREVSSASLYLMLYSSTSYKYWTQKLRKDLGVMRLQKERKRIHLEQIQCAGNHAVQTIHSEFSFIFFK